MYLQNLCCLFLLIFNHLNHLRKFSYITDHEGWRAMLKSRNVFTHVYDESEILATVRLIYSEFAPLLKTLDDKLEVLSHNPDYQ